MTRRAGTRGGGGGRPRASSRAGSRAERRADSVVEVDDDQLVAEDDDALPPPSVPAGPRARVAVHEQSVGQLGTIRVIIDSFHHTVIAAGSGGEGINRVLAAMRGEDPPGVVITAIPGGEPIVDAARMLEPRRPVVVITGPGDAYDLGARADKLGAELFATRPHDAERLAPILAAAARLAAEREELVAIKGAHQMLRQKVDAGADLATAGGVRGFDSFHRVLEIELKRARRYNYPLSVALLELGVFELPAGGERILRARATAAIVGAVRDIDLITELDDGRLLVLLPYTDLDGAENVGVRLVHAVRSQPPVVIGDVSAQAELRIGVAGLRPGQPLSFARLMKDANAALAQAHADLIDLVVHA
jgi:two-component system, cell cycle response regulator